MPSNAFLSQADTDTYNRVCPIDKNYAQKIPNCTGSYRQGGFQFYPPFVMKGCQCANLLGDDEEEYSTPLRYVTDEKQTEVLENPASPCIVKFENE